MAATNDEADTASYAAAAPCAADAAVATTPPGVKIDWAAALAEHERWLRTIAHARLGQAQGVDEVLQEVALAAIKQAAPIHDATKVAPWLYRLTVIQCLLHRRGLGRRRKLTDRYNQAVPRTEADPRQHDPLSWLLADERQRLVRVALEQLPTRDREVLLLKYTEDWNYHRIATHLGLSHAAVETRLHRAARNSATRCCVWKASWNQSRRVRHSVCLRDTSIRCVSTHRCGTSCGCATTSNLGASRRTLHIITPP
ncbi:MAG: sigma-70 family RNA polymerase sigma factor [Pirellulales bacterium]